MLKTSCPLLGLLLFVGCASPSTHRMPVVHGSHAPVFAGDPPRTTEPAQRPQELRRGLPVQERWDVNSPWMQGHFGFSKYTTAEVNDGSTIIDGDRGDLDQMPAIGGGGQWKLGGERIDYGLEGLFSISGRGGVTAFAIGGGGGAVVVDVDLLLLELYGGPFVNVFLGEKFRVYGSVGPLFQFAEYDQRGGGLNNDGSGFGVGTYARAGVEYLLPGATWLGIGARWSDTTVDLGAVGDLDTEGFQGLITVTRSY